MPRTLRPSSNVYREGASGEACGVDDNGSVLSEIVDQDGIDHDEAVRIVDEQESSTCMPCESDATGGAHETTPNKLKVTNIHIHPMRHRGKKGQSISLLTAHSEAGALIVSWVRPRPRHTL